ncbi:M23 family metallopeptidase [Leucobacter chironomi]|uniref:M23 family metallopeptidase n=1 Tax=Leucobacter chironomi TaxID=491918 RepID=UPI0004244BDD|nr:M23 family metallopeptidase [Leucobacter chironomi]
MTDAPDLSEPRGSVGSGYPSRRSLRAQQAATQHEAPSTETGSVRLPLVEHVPAAQPPTATAPPPPVPMRRRIAAAAAAASVCGLVLTVSLPLVSPTDAGSPAGGVVLGQELFSEVSLDELPTSFSEISASVSDDGSPSTFTFRPQALVNYPFTSGVTLTDGFGYRTAPVEQFHDAQDFAASAGTPIQVIADGKVVEAGFASDGCGFGLKVEHELAGTTATSRYCHMETESHSYRVGDVVSMGDRAGSVGNTGMSFGPHLHLAIRVDDQPVDPMPFFAKYTRMDRPKDAPSGS